MPRSTRKSSGRDARPRGAPPCRRPKLSAVRAATAPAETAQDYVEAIADLTAALGEARVVDLARRLGVTHVTVNRTLARLQQAGYVNTRPYRAIFLTEAGHRLARESKRRHETVAAFLRSLGISGKSCRNGRRGHRTSRQPGNPGRL